MVFYLPVPFPPSPGTPLCLSPFWAKCTSQAAHGDNNPQPIVTWTQPLPAFPSGKAKKRPVSSSTVSPAAAGGDDADEALKYPKSGFFVPLGEDGKANLSLGKHEGSPKRRDHLWPGHLLLPLYKSSCLGPPPFFLFSLLFFLPPPLAGHRWSIQQLISFCLQLCFKRCNI